MNTPAIFRTIILIGVTALAACTGADTRTRYAGSRNAGGNETFPLSVKPAKMEALMRGMGCGSVPAPMVRRHIETGRLVHKATVNDPRIISLHYAWRQATKTGSQKPGKALAWWLTQLQSPTTRRALLEQHEGLLL